MMEFSGLRAPIFHLQSRRFAFLACCKQVEPGGTRLVGLQPTVIASRAPHLLLEQSVMTRFKESWTCVARQEPGKIEFDIFLSHRWNVFNLAKLLCNTMSNNINLQLHDAVLFYFLCYSAVTISISIMYI